MANYPTSLDSFTSPNVTDYLNSPSHVTQHSDVNVATVALETKLGIGASPASSAAASSVLLADGAGSSSWTTIVNASITAAAGIVYSKLTLTDSILNADINSAAAIALSKLATGALPTGITIASANITDDTIVNADINSAAAIAYSKLALTGAVLNADLAGSIDKAKITNTAATLSDTQTLTNKRVTKRIGTTASSSTPTPASDDVDMYTVTALAAAATFGAPTGTPTNGQSLIIRIKDNGAARTLAFNAAYRFSSDLSAPTTTVISKTMYLGFVWNSADSKWDCVAFIENI